MNTKTLVVVSLVAPILYGCGGTEGGKETSTSAAPVAKKLAAAVVSSGGVATFTGNRSNYSIVKTATGYTVTDNVGVDGVSALNNVQTLKFADFTVNLAISEKAKTISTANLQSLIELYIAFFNRVPDADGLSYWIDQFKAGQSLNQIADSFYDAAIQYSSLTGYTATMSNADFVRIIYKNVLGRSGDTAPPDADVQFWAGELAGGRASKGSLVTTMLGSAHSFTGDATWGWVSTLLDNKIAVGSYFSVSQALNYNTTADSITNTMAIAAAVSKTGTTEAISKIAVSDTSFTSVAQIPGAPTIGTATAGSNNASIAFTAPKSNGGAAITAYTVTCTSAGAKVTASGTASPIAVTGLTTGVVYSCSVAARNAIGTGLSSGTVSVTPVTTSANGSKCQSANWTLDATTGLPPGYDQIGTRATVYKSGNYVVIETTVIPDHKSAYFSKTDSRYEAYTAATFKPNQGTITAQHFVFKLPLQPTCATKTSDTTGMVGVAANGILLYNQYNAQREPLGGEIAGMDQYNGHPDFSNAYHYHLEPLWLTSKSKSALVGWALDGYPVYGPQNPDGSTPVLDSCNGQFSATPEFPKGVYHYNVTSSPPYLVGCYVGNAGTVSQ